MLRYLYMKKLLPVLLFGVLLSVFVLLSPAYAANGNGRVTAQAAKAERKLPEASLRSCQARESAIQQRMIHLSQLAKTLENKFGDIALRVEAYYTNIVVPAGKTVTNYSTLVTNIETKKAAVDAELAKASTDSAGFTCSGSDPRAQMTLFRTDMQAVKNALKDYKTSVRNLIVAIHTVGGNVGEESPSPKATTSAQEGK